jgi:hypothetical protein
MLNSVTRGHSVESRSARGKGCLEGERSDYGITKEGWQM